MVEIAAFRALRYAPAPDADLSGRVAPPYDVIRPAGLRRLWARDPYNAVRLILPAGDLPPTERERGYALAPERLRVWKRRGVLVADRAPSLYLYRQRFRLSSGEARARQGFFGLASLTEWGEGIYRHELTLPGPVADRVRLLNACQANLSPVFGLYSDPEQEVVGLLSAQADGRPPIAEATDDEGVWHGLWQVSDPTAVQRAAALLRERPIIIADGHHRYTAALAYRNRRRANDGASPAPWDYVLLYFGALEDPGLAILPTHQALRDLRGLTPDRLLQSLQQSFRVQEEPGLASLLARLAGLAGTPDAVLGMVAGQRYYLLRGPRPQDDEAPEEALDVAILRRRVVEPLLAANGAGDELATHLRYTHQAAEAASWVEAGEAQVAFLLRPTPLEQVRSLALAQRVMPQKSTYFYPKLLSGLVFYDYALWQPAPVAEVR